MSTWLAALVAAGAVTATYVFCVRPMWRGRGRCPTAVGVGHRDAEVSRQIAELHEELRILRAEGALGAGKLDRGRPPTAS